jgi:putative phosphoesterase
MITVGIISDTHSLLRTEALQALEGCDLIVHAGDIGAIDVIDGLSAIAPVHAVRGNIDKDAWASKFPNEEIVSVAGKYLYVLHDRHEIALEPAAAGFDVVISGHSHKPAIEQVDGVLFVNPGSAGPRRFTLPVAIATLRVTSKTIQANIQELFP